MKKLIIHIGSEKTGTTSIQHFMAKNRNALKKQGVIYPEVGFSKTAHFSLVAPFHGLDNDGKPLEFAPKKDYRAEDEWRAIKNIFSDNDDVTVVVSAEHFSSRLREKGIAALREIVHWACSDAKVEIIYYVRRQDKYFQSWYSTHIKAGGVLSLDEAYSLRLNQRWFYDYYHIANAWAKEFGEGAIKVIPFERVQLPEGLYENFCRHIGIALNENFDFGVNDENESWPFKFLQFARLVNLRHQTMPISNRFEVLNKFRSHFNSESKSIISPLDACRVIEKYKESNYLLAKYYLKRPDGWLFESEDIIDQEWCKPADLSVDDLVYMFIDMAKSEK